MLSPTNSQELTPHVAITLPPRGPPGKSRVFVPLSEPFRKRITAVAGSRSLPAHVRRPDRCAHGHRKKLRPPDNPIHSFLNSNSMCDELSVYAAPRNQVQQER